MVDSLKEVPVADKHFAEHGYTVPQEILALVASGELKDLSWHNDAAPCYGVVLLDEVNVSIWVDHVDQKAREVLDGERFYVSVYNHEHVGLHPHNDGQIGGTNNVDEAITKWRETVAAMKAQIADPRPRFCEACNIVLLPDRTCSECGVSHSGDACPTCGGFALHKPDCNQPPLGNGFECGPKYVDARQAEVDALVAEFNTTYAKHGAWEFEYMYPGNFSYSVAGSDVIVFFTPDWTTKGIVDIQVSTTDGEHFEKESGEAEFKTDRSAAALFNIIKPYLDKLTGKTSSDLKS